jgi:hypothetical protein
MTKAGKEARFKQKEEGINEKMEKVKLLMISGLRQKLKHNC